MAEKAHIQDVSGVENPEVKHEKTDISPRVVAIFAGSLVAGAIIVHLLIYVVFGLFQSITAGAYPREYPLAPVGLPQLPPAPRLQTNPREDLKAMRAEEDQRLTTYGWVDQAGGVVRIPIDQAMQLLLKQGLPARPAPPPGPREGLPTASSSGRVLLPPER